MGLFLAASGVVDRDGEQTAAGIAAYAASSGGIFEFRANETDDSKIGGIQSTTRSTTVLYPRDFLDWECSKFLSSTLQTAVFSFHIHDGDLWMFVVFDKGEEVAWFNPVPDYWGNISSKERLQWKGDPERTASLVTGVTPESIQHYLRTWTDVDYNAQHKAYPDDDYFIGEDFQLFDFMRRLKFDFPFDANGEVSGQTFSLTVPDDRLELPRVKPWWKFW